MSKIVETTAQAIMIPNPYCVSEDALASKILGEMLEKRIMSAIVVDGQRIKGIVTSTDFVDAIADHEHGEWLVRTPLSEIMATALIYVKPTASVLEVAKKMHQSRVRHIIVMDVFEPIGIISHIEILTWWHSSHA